MHVIFKGKAVYIKKCDHRCAACLIPAWEKISILGIVEVIFRYELIQNVRSTFSTWFNMHQPPSLGGSQGEPVYGLTLKKQSFNCHYFITVKGFPSKCKPNLYELCSSMYFIVFHPSVKTHSNMFAFWHGTHSNLPNNAWICLAMMLRNKKEEKYVICSQMVWFNGNLPPYTPED